MQELLNIKDEKEFDRALDEATGFQSNNNLPTIKFNAVEGIWRRSDGEKGVDGHVEYSTELGDSIDLHIINSSFQLASSGDDSPVYVYSREYVGQYVELINANKKIEESGYYKDLKELFDLKYTKILYSSYLEELVRVKLSGFGLVKWFPYMSENGNPARYMTTLKAGIRMRGHQGKEPSVATKEEIDKFDGELKAGKKPTINLFYALDIVKGDDLDRAIMIERVNGLNTYLRSRNSETLASVPKDKGVVTQVGPEADADLNLPPADLA